MQILIVDDNETLCIQMARHLTNHGYLVETATDGKKALEKLSTKPFQLSITDLNMPNLDGFELIKLIRQRHPSVNILAMSGHPTEHKLKELKANGAVKFLHKPFRMRKVLDYLAEIE